jgi:hypothetical protein
MRKITLLAVITLSSILFVNSQNINIGLSAGVSFPKMQSSRSQMEGKLKVLPFEAKITDNFPAWIEYKAEYYRDFDDYMLGFYIVRNSTGGRISSKDFSANYHFDVKMRNNVLGFNTKLLLDEYKQTRFFFCIGGGIEHLKTDLYEAMELLGNNKKVVYLDASKKKESFHAIFGLTTEVKLSKKIMASAYFHYYFSSTRKEIASYNTSFDYNYHLSPKWNGLRSGLSVFFIFPDKKDTQ